MSTGTDPFSLVARSSACRCPASWPGARAGLQAITKAVDKPDFTYQLRINVTAIEFEQTDGGTSALCFVCIEREHAANVKAWLAMAGIADRIRKGYEAFGTRIGAITARAEE